MFYIPRILPLTNFSLFASGPPDQGRLPPGPSPARQRPPQDGQTGRGAHRRGECAQEGAGE